MENAFPRVYSTNKLSKRGIAQMYGPFPSRLAAERYCDAVLDLFKLRRCYEDLAPYPEHPGCVYGEMEKCIEPCKQACTPEQYAAEAAAVKKFFDTRGESMVIAIGLEREEASSGMQFEKAAALHAQWQKIKAVQALADWIVRPVPRLRAVIVQSAAPEEDHKEQAALFLLEGGCLVGPERLSTLGVRAVREQTSVGSSLFAQPLMLQAVPLEGESASSDTANSPEDRAIHALKVLEEKVGKSNDLALLSDHLSLLRRWYYRPEKQRTGEIFFANEDGTWPIRKILRGAARMVIGEPKPIAETQRNAAKAAKTKSSTKADPTWNEPYRQCLRITSKVREDSQFERLTASGPNACCIGIICTRLMLTWTGSVVDQNTASATSSAVSGWTPRYTPAAFSASPRKRTMENSVPPQSPGSMSVTRTGLPSRSALRFRENC